MWLKYRYVRLQKVFTILNRYVQKYKWFERKVIDATPLLTSLASLASLDKRKVRGSNQRESSPRRYALLNRQPASRCRSEGD
jgi:hypothetical protein